MNTTSNSTNTGAVITVDGRNQLICAFPDSILRADCDQTINATFSFSRPLQIQDAINDNEAISKRQVQTGRGLLGPSQLDHRTLGYCHRSPGQPVAYMDRLYNAGSTPIGFGQLNGTNGGDGNNYAWTVLTMTLDLPFLKEAVRQPGDIENSALGQTAFFGLGGTLPRAAAILRSTSAKNGGLLKSYDVQCCGDTHWNSHSGLVKTVPALFSSDYHLDNRIRVGFAPSFSGSGNQTYDHAISGLTDSKVSLGLLAHLPDDAVRIILVWGNHFTGTKLLPSSCTGMWVERQNGNRVFIGWSMTSYSFAKIGLILAPFGQSGVGAFRVHAGDVFGLATGSRPSTELCYPLKACMFVSDATAQTKLSSILLMDKTCTIDPVDPWIGVTDDGQGGLTIEIEENTTGEDRRGLCDITLSNGLTYSIHVTQKAV